MGTDSVMGAKGRFNASEAIDHLRKHFKCEAKGSLYGNKLGNLVANSVKAVLWCFGIRKDVNLDDVTEEVLYQQYEEGVTSFVKNNIISGIVVNEEMETKFIALGKDIFRAMKFEVTSKEELNDKEHHVVVTYQPSDVFVKYVKYVQDESENINEKVENGEYKIQIQQKCFGTGKRNLRQNRSKNHTILSK